MNNELLRPAVLVLSITLSVIVVGAAYLSGYDNIQAKPDGLAKIIMLVLLINVIGAFAQIGPEVLICLRAFQDWRKTKEEKISEESRLTREEIEFLRNIIHSQRRAIDNLWEVKSQPKGNGDIPERIG